MRCLGIDFGSSTIKGGVLDLESGKVSEIVRAPFPSAIRGLPAGFHEVAAVQIIEESRRVIEGLSERAPDARHLLSASQMGGLLLTNSQHEPLTNYMSWRDQRSLGIMSNGQSYLQSLRQCWSADQFSQLGRELKPGSASSLLYWLRHQDQIPQGALAVSVGDFVLSQLCQAAPCWDRTLAIGLLDLTTSQWHHAAFASAGIESCNWPQLIEIGVPLGRLATNSGSLTCYAALGDQQAALRGVNLQRDELSINCSTGSQVSEIKSDFLPGEYQSRCWFGGSFLNTITHIPAGRSLAVLESLLTELPRLAGITFDNSWELIAQAVQQSADQSRSSTHLSDKGRRADGLTCDLSFFDSALGFDGRIGGITTENFTVGNLFEAALEYMADAYYRCGRQINRNMAWKRVVVSGGLIQSFPTLKQRLTARFPLPFREVSEQEETLLGLLEIARDIL